ncbi:VOC family protein [Aliiroseovarius sp. PrR006]|uniref:VOC family protein n=1 Tax=Aliiroseovarius sp. PrR006 TaxID=2706883 RepID=UPI001942DCD7|nr:VOC family protein [Aliiroseovarius sp. PrR006]
MSQREDHITHLGAFSVSLGVKDLAASRVFCEVLGFTAYAGTEERNYLIMRNGDTLAASPF